MIFDSVMNMTLGMMLGMAVSPLMMKVIRDLRQKYRVNKILRQISQLQRETEFHLPT
jgi:hypothetical protein